MTKREATLVSRDEPNYILLKTISDKNQSSSPMATAYQILLACSWITNAKKKKQN